MNDIKNVCVYSASSTKIAKVYFDVAEELGRLLAEKMNGHIDVQSEVNKGSRFTAVLPYL